MSVDSCSLYEFRITAVSRYGESKPVYLVQYTGYPASIKFDLQLEIRNAFFKIHLKFH